MPLMSIVINTYNGADVLPRAIRSVLAQDLTDCEVVIADDGSDEPTEDLIRAEFPGEPLLFTTHPNAGLSAARNLGVRRSSGDYLVFLDDDDEFVADGIATLKGLIETDETVGLACGAAEAVVEDGSEPTVVFVPKDHGADLEHQVVCNLAGAFAISRSVFTEIGGFDEDLRCNHQRELFLRAVPWCVDHGHAVKSTDRTTVRWNRQPAGRRSRNQAARLQGCLEHILAKHHDRLSTNPFRLASMYASAGVAAARAGNLRTARRHFLSSVRTKPTELANVRPLAVSTVPPLARRAWPTADQPGTGPMVPPEAP